MGVDVRVPATVANLGPGFDCLGVAVGVHLELSFSLADKVEIVGGDPSIPVEDDLTHRAFVSAYAAVGEEAPPVRIEVLGAYPQGRGLGASAAAIVGGLVGARAAGDLDVADSALARLAIRIEGHADNVLPAMFGGVVLASADGWIRLTPAPGVLPFVLVAPGRFVTAEARRALPAEVPRADAVANAAATAALVAVLSGLEPPAALMMATADRIHEPYRLPLLPETLDLHQELRAKGIAAALSGAGPSVVCLSASDAIEDAVALARTLLPAGWEVMVPGWDLHGAQVR
jgi:homoserine kinase